MGLNDRVFKVTLDGVDFVDFDGTEGLFVETSWHPAVAVRRRGALGGRGPYMPVEEMVPVIVRGSTVGEVLERRDKLAQIVERAADWQERKSTAPVVLNFHFDQSSATSGQCAILGPPARRPVLEFRGLPEKVSTNFQQDVMWRFMRAAQWLVTEDSDTTLAVEVAEIATANMAAEESFLSPTRLLSATLPTAVTSDVTPSGFVIVTADTGMEIGTGGTWPTADWDTTSSSPYNGLDDLIHFTKGGVTDAYVLIGATESVLRDAKRVTAFVCVKVTAGTWKATPYLQIGASSSFPDDGSFVVGTPIYIDNTNPEVHALAAVSIPVVRDDKARFQFMYIRFERVEGSGVLSVNYWCLVNASDENTNVIRLTQGTKPSTAAKFEVNHQLLQSPQPFVGLNEGPTQPLGDAVPLVYEHSPYWFTRAEDLNLVYLWTLGANWRFTFDITHTVARYPGHLLPQ
jgi:hypothetical protein